ncbi:ferritin-like domain-containing protein [Streptacidiphilus sp. MAP5-3]|uniref:ferritin-like domain-containing protein n=1 Tax=unclassified Streptacidiphilus TaxID=2643834 RepID=UPI003518A59E
MAVLLRRRSLLSAGLLTVLTACGGTTAQSASGSGASSVGVDPDTAARRRVGAAMTALLAAYDNSRQDTPDLRRLLAAELATVDPGAARAAGAAGAAKAAASAQATVTASPSPRAVASVSTSASASAAASASGSASPRASAAPVSNAVLGARESALATQCATELLAVSPALARLLASVSAGAAQRAVVLGAPAPATAEPTSASAPAHLSAAELSSLQAALGAEDAAVYGYGVIGAQLSGSDRDRASTDFDLHRARRDALSARITAAGARPQAAAAAYVLPFDVTDAGSARRLAALLETRLAAVYANGVQAATGALRTEAATELRAAALRGLSWGGTPTAFPGLPEPASSS